MLVLLASFCGLCNLWITPPAQKVLVASASFMVLLLGAVLAVSPSLVWVIVLSLMLGMTAIPEFVFICYVCLVQPIAFLDAPAHHRIALSELLHIPATHVHIVAALLLWTADVLGIWLYLKWMLGLPLQAQGSAVLHSLLLPTTWWTYDHSPPFFEATICTIALGMLAAAIICSARRHLTEHRIVLPGSYTAPLHSYTAPARKGNRRRRKERRAAGSH